jgi:hypothetical protein
MVPVKFPDFKWSLAEEPQQLGVRFAFYNNVGRHVEPVHPFVKCRDFLGDMVYANYHKKKVSIYGFTAPETTEFSQWTSLLIEFDNQTLRKTFWDQACALYRYYYGNLAFWMAETDSPDHLLVELDYEHQRSVLAISMLTFLLKCAAVPHESFDNLEPGLEKYPKELGYYKQTKDLLLILSRNLSLIHKDRKGVTGHPNEESLSPSVIHHGSGFISLITLEKNGNMENEYVQTIRNLKEGIAQSDYGIPVVEEVLLDDELLEVVEDDLDEEEDFFDEEIAPQAPQITPVITW